MYVKSVWRLQVFESCPFRLVVFPFVITALVAKSFIVLLIAIIDVSFLKPRIFHLKEKVAQKY